MNGKQIIPPCGVSMVRVHDEGGEVLVAAAVPHERCDFFGVDDPDGWMSGCLNLDGIVIETSGVVQITNCRDAAALAAWMTQAAVWLRIRDMEDEGGDI